MNIVDRAKNILLSPKTEWPVIAAEPSSVGDLMKYAAILALIPLVASLIGSLLLSGGAAALGLGFVLVPIIVGYFIGLAVLWVMGIIAGALAPSFDGQNAQLAGLKLIVYSATAVYVAGILNIIPGIGMIASIVGLIYGIYLIYLGAGPVMAVPAAKTGGYTAVVVVIWIILNLVVAGVIIAAIASAFVGSAAMAGAAATYG